MKRKGKPQKVQISGEQCKALRPLFSVTDDQLRLDFNLIHSNLFKKVKPNYLLIREKKLDFTCLCVRECAARFLTWSQNILEQILWGS